MTWIYHQSSGKLFRNGKLMGTGYAGKDAGKNAPDLQGTADIGRCRAANTPLARRFIILIRGITPCVSRLPRVIICLVARAF
ncbi:hypothetical protein [Cronobacter dublinensis]|uniref:hypothetical protein n=1 Tax=Cronobacter dublinensis TaxID=413497 RepID=UPI001F33723F|nr:hypothetical protein [Cronobacter dublinensis]